MIRLRPSGADEVLIKRVQDWYEPGPGVFIQSLTASFSPAMLFTGSTNGAWYDPSDITTLYQDAAGTTPVTAVEQPVGRMLDKSGRGNHAFNSSGNSANFPVLSARYNLLTKTEQFDDAAWTKSNSTVTANAVVAPDGTTTADKLVENTAASVRHYVNATAVGAVFPAIVSVWMKAAERTFGFIGDGQVGPVAVINLIDGSIVSSNALYAPITVRNDGNGWFNVSITKPSVGAGASMWVGIADNSGGAIYTGDGTSGIYIWGADLRVANDALNQPAYQRVNTSSDYDTVGFKPYLRFNGTNQWLQTNSIDFTYGDKMFVSAGVRNIGTSEQILVELSNTYSNANAFGLTSPSNSGSGTLKTYQNAATMAATSTITAPPYTFVVAALYNNIVSGASVANRVNGSPNGSTSGTGGGNFGNYPLYIGARGGASLWFNGRLYQMVVAGKQASADEITNTETFINQKTGAY